MDQLQVTLKARDELTNEVKRATKEMAKLEVAIKEATQAGSPQAAQQVDKLEGKLRAAQTRAQRSTAAVGQLDQKIEQLGGSAGETARDLDKMNREAASGTAGMDKMKGAAAKASVAVAAIATAAVGAAVGLKRVTDMAILYEKKLRRTDVVFGKQAVRLRAWAKANADAFGASTEDVAAYMASVGDILKPLGFTTREATGLTMGIGKLIPALTDWNTAGMDAEQVTQALTAALTGEREMLKSLGIVISEEDVKAKVAAMQATGKFTDETEKQRKAIATLTLATEGSADALAAAGDGQDTAARRMKRLRSQVGELRDSGLEVFLGVWQRFSDALSGSDIGNPMKGFGDFVRDNKDAIVSFILRVASGIARWTSLWLKWESVVIKGAGYVVGGIASLLKAMALVNPEMRGAADKADALARGLGETSAAMDRGSKRAGNLADELGEQADQAARVQERLDAVRQVLQGIKSKKIRLELETYAKQNDGSLVPYSNDYIRSLSGPAGDTATPMGAGHLGAAGLAAAHAGFASQLGGHSITSGVRSWGLGSANSDHLHGRAMDITGPRMGAYAQIVRRSGGYAAMHGAGANRHLHVVPKTRRPAPSGGNTFRADVTVVNPQSEMDIQASVARGLRAAARQDSERS